MSIRDDVRRWLEENWTPGDDGFRERAVDSGWLAPPWSTDWYGRGLSAADAEVVGEEFTRVGAPGRLDRDHLHARVIYELGSDQLKSTYLRDLLTALGVLPPFHAMGILWHVMIALVHGDAIAVFAPQVPNPPLIPNPENILESSRLA